MKKFVINSILLSILFLNSCCSDNSGKVALALLVGGGHSQNHSDYSSEIPTDIEENLELKDEFNWRHSMEKVKIMIPNQNHLISWDPTSSKLQKRNIITGDLIWSWEHSFLSNANLPNENSSYFYEDLMVFNIWDNYFCLNINTGKTVWEKEISNTQRAVCDQAMTGIGEFYFQIRRGEINGVIQDLVFYGNINNADPLEYLIHPDYQTTVVKDGKIGEITGFKAFKNSAGDNCLAITYAEPTAELWDKNIFISIWNMTNSEWEYKKALTVSTNTQVNIKIIDSYLYCCTRDKIFCSQLETGELIWEKGGDSFNLEVAFSNTHIITKWAYMNMEVLDPKTGETQWSHSEYSPFNLDLSQHFIYIFSDHKIQIFNISTGVLIKTIDYPYTEYPVGYENIEYFSSTGYLKSWEDRSNNIDYLIIGTDKYSFGMEHGF